MFPGLGAFLGLTFSLTRRKIGHAIIYKPITAPRWLKSTFFWLSRISMISLLFCLTNLEDGTTQGLIIVLFLYGISLVLNRN